MWYIHTLTSSEIKRNELLNLVKTWIILNVVCSVRKHHSEKIHIIRFRLLDIMEKGRTVKMVNSVCQGIRGWEEERLKQVKHKRYFRMVKSLCITM